MARRLFFFGLTLVLTAALIGLTVRSCRLEKEPVPQVMEMIKESAPSATRVLKPKDLEIAQSKMNLEKNRGEAKPSFTARHQLEISNHGKVPYKGIQLSFTYSIRNGKVTQTRTYWIDQSILPGSILRLADIRIDGLPEFIEGSQVRIPYADMETASARKQ